MQYDDVNWVVSTKLFKLLNIMPVLNDIPVCLMVIQPPFRIRGFDIKHCLHFAIIYSQQQF